MSPSACVFCERLPVLNRTCRGRRTRCPACKGELLSAGGGQVYRVNAEVRIPSSRVVVCLGAIVGALAVCLAALVLWSNGPERGARLAATSPPAPSEAAPIEVLPVAVAEETEVREALFVLKAGSVQPLGLAEKGAAAVPVTPPKPREVARPMPPRPAVTPVFYSEAKLNVLLERVPEVSLELAPNRFLLEKIESVNRKAKDGFILQLQKERRDIAGLPFLLGDACRLEKAAARDLSRYALRTRVALDAAFRSPLEQVHPGEYVPVRFWTTFLTGIPQRPLPGAVPALVQIMGPTPPGLRESLVNELKACEQPTVTRVLAQQALFDLNSDVRLTALEALRDRPREEYTPRLLEAFRHPWPPVAHHAAVAAVFLNRTDLVPELVNLLDEPDPAAPVFRTVEDNEEVYVRQLVKLNHNKNCLLCHPPLGANERAAVGNPALEFPVGRVPLPSEPLPPTFSPAYYGESPNGMFVRADATYLRQDFSAMQFVANAKPWPDSQRFDFLVRIHKLEGRELATCAPLRTVAASDHGQAVIYALRQLTGRYATTSREWRQVLAAKDGE